jgi:hypothetical protein
LQTVLLDKTAHHLSAILFSLLAAKTGEKAFLITPFRCDASYHNSTYVHLESDFFDKVWGYRFVRRTNLFRIFALVNAIAKGDSLSLIRLLKYHFFNYSADKSVAEI